MDNIPAGYESITVETGAQKYALLDKDGDKLGEFKFHPSDSRILRRYEKVVDFFNSDDFSNSVSDSDDSDLSQFLELEDKVAQQFDFLLGYPVSDGLFCGCGAFSPTSDGDLYFEKALEAIAGVIEKTTNQRIQKKLKKIRKVTAKYEKR